MAIAGSQRREEHQPPRAVVDERTGAALRERLTAIVGSLEAEAEKRIGHRDLVEKRWLEDIRQYHGVYEDKVLKNIKEAGGSELFITATRAKTNALEARLTDMLFPTDDKNWGIGPTPVPELASEAKEAVRQAQEAVDEANALEDQGKPEQARQVAEGAAPFAEKAKKLKAEMDEAKRRASGMEDEIEDQLREAKYQAESRDAIRDACRIGSGIMKGPMVATRMRQRWKKSDKGENVYELTPTTDPRPTYYHVDSWSFFPDMDARSMEDCESTFERHLMNKKELKKLARQPGFEKDAIRRLLKQDPRQTTPQFVADLRSITGAFHDSGSDRYHVWEYHGPLSTEEIRDIALALQDPEKAQDIPEETEIDPLTDMQVIIWFCDGELLKFGIHPLDSGETLYSVFCIEKDEASIFGFGLPHIIRDSQKALNGAWRMMMDNSGLTAGPQIEINQNVVEPADGDWRLAPRKTWLRKSDAPGGEDAFRIHNIDSHQAEMANVIMLAKENIDEESMMPMLAQGEQGAHPEQTVGGMAILMNSANVVFRRIVKNYDDDMTTPNIRRLYDWNMQHSKKAHIKGDYDVDARGTSVLLVREIQAQNLMVLLFQGTTHPVVGPLTKVPELYRKLVQSMMIPADDVVKTEDELQAEAANTPPDPDIELLKLENQMNIAQMEADNRLQVATVQRDTVMMQLAAQHNMTLEELRNKLQIKQMETASKERIFASEVAVEQRLAREGNATGSGGYVSAGGNREAASA